jgi:hypothetical protein
VIVYGHFYKSDKEVVEERQMLCILCILPFDIKIEKSVYDEYACGSESIKCSNMGGTGLQDL